MRAVTLRVPDGWHGLVDSWAVQVMLKDFSRRHVLPQLVVDPQPGRARLSLSLPEFRTQEMPESVFLRRLIASYLPALKSFKSSQHAVPSARLHGRVREVEERVIDENTPSPRRLVSTENSRPERGSDYTRQHVVYNARQISWGSNVAAGSDAPTSLVPRQSKDFILTLIVISIVAILVALLFIRRSGLRVPSATVGAPQPGYQPWTPKAF